MFCSAVSSEFRLLSSDALLSSLELPPLGITISEAALNKDLTLLERKQCVMFMAAKN